MKIKHVFVLVALGFSVNAIAAGWEKGPCAEDVKKLCSNVEKGEGRIIRCLKEHDAQLTEACKAKRDEKKSKHKAKVEAKLKKLEESKAPAPAPGTVPAAQ